MVRIVKTQAWASKKNLLENANLLEAFVRRGFS